MRKEKEISNPCDQGCRCHVKRHLAVLSLENNFKSISHINHEHFAIASAGFFAFCWLVSPFRERNHNFIELSLKNH